MSNQNTGISSVGQSVVQNAGQTFTLATVLPPRQQAATLVYSNPQNQQYQQPGQRLAVATSLGTQRQVRPIQIGTRLPTSAMGLRVSAANISIRAPSVPVLAPASVLTSISNTGQGRSGVTATTTNLSTGIPATRIIQVQQQQSGTAQVLNTSRLPGNLMTLHPVIMSNPGSGNRIPTTISAKVQPSLTITHVKSAMGQPNNAGGAIVTQNTQQSTQSGANQHMQLVSVNQQGVLNQGHQLVTVSQQQLIAAQNQQSGVATVVPLSINTRTTNALTATMTSISGNIRGANAASVSTGTTILPIAKVLPQQQQNQLVAEIQQHQHANNTTSANVTNQQILLHARSPSTTGAVTPVSVGGGNVSSNVGQFIPSGGTYYYEHVANSSSGNTVLTLTQTSSASSISNAQQNLNSVNTSNIATSVNYTPTGGGSFAVVPTNNRTINQIHSMFYLLLILLVLHIFDC